MVRDITARLRATSDLEIIESASSAAVAHGKLRFLQGYTIPMIVQESQNLAGEHFETIQRNIATVDFNSVLADVMIIADEADSQLKQCLESFVSMQHAPAHSA